MKTHSVPIFFFKNHESRIVMILSITSSLLLDKNKFKYLAEIGVNKPKKTKQKANKSWTNSSSTPLFWKMTKKHILVLYGYSFVGSTACSTNSDYHILPQLAITSFQLAVKTLDLYWKSPESTITESLLLITLKY